MGPLFRLSSKGVAETEFDTSGALINRYAVRPDGGVVMMRVEETTKIVDTFAPDGTRQSSVALERPPIPFFPSQLAVFHSGEILISGLQYQPGSKAGTAIYDPTGHLIKQVVLDGDVDAIAQDTRAQQKNTSAIDTAVAITGDDGLVYLIRATSPPSSMQFQLPVRWSAKLWSAFRLARDRRISGFEWSRTDWLFSSTAVAKIPPLPTLAGVPLMPSSMPPPARNLPPTKRTKKQAVRWCATPQIPTASTFFQIAMA